MDIGLVGLLSILAPISLCTSEKTWVRLCRPLSRLAFILKRPHPRFVEKCRYTMDWSAEETMSVIQEKFLNQILMLCYICRLYRDNPANYLAPVQNFGVVQNALKAGRGVILWVQPFCFSDVFTKAACYEAGLRVAHLSRHDHGPSLSLFGRLFLNPVKVKIENKFLHQRIVLRPDDSVRAIRQVVDLVRRGQVVSITVGKWAKQKATVPFGKGKMVLSTAPAGLAWKTGAALIPVYTLKTPRGMACRFGPELPLDRDKERDRSVREAILIYAQTLYEEVRAEPGQFQAWTQVGPVPLPVTGTSVESGSISDVSH